MHGRAGSPLRFARTVRIVAATGLLAACLLGLASVVAADGAPPMRKYVSKNAYFVLYAPLGWTVTEGAGDAFWSVAVQAPSTGARTILFHGRSPVGDDVRKLTGNLLEDLRRRQGTRFTSTRVSPQGDRLHVRGQYVADAGRPMEFRAWTHVRGGDFTFTRVEAPRGRYEVMKAALLSPLVNLVPIRGRFGRVAAQPLPMRSYTLPQGAGTCLVPVGWKVVPFGGHFMMATDPQQKYGFFVGYDQAVTPRSRIRSGYVAMSPYLPPHQAVAFFAQKKRLASNFRMLQVNRQHELTRGLMALYRGGRAEAEDCTYTFDSKGRRFQGFTIGFSGMPTLGLNWGFSALTVTAPVAEFPAMAATFAKMMASYRINDQYARAYVEAGRRRVQQMTAQTIRIIQRNRAEIQQMMNEVYRERQLSQDYIDYQRTRYIRGESDWVSAREDGTVYRSDRWGLQNQTTGGRLEAQPFNYFNFRGSAGGYGDLREINSREMWQRAYGH